MPFDQRSLIHREAWFPACFERQNQQKKLFFLCGDFRQLSSKNVQMLDHFFPLLFHKNSESLKNIGHPTLGSGGKKTSKRYLKSEQTNGQKDTQTDRPTFRLIESIGPEGRCFENLGKPDKFR